MGIQMYGKKAATGGSEGGHQLGYACQLHPEPAALVESVPETKGRIELTTEQRGWCH